MSNIGGPSHEDFGVRALRGRFPIPFLRSLCHHDRDCPCNTGYFHPLLFPSPPCSPPGLLGSRRFCGASARLLLKYANLIFAPRSFLSGSSTVRVQPNRRLAGPTTISVLHAPYAAFFRSLFTSYLSSKPSSVLRGKSLFPLTKPFSRQSFSFQLD